MENLSPAVEQYDDTSEEGYENIDPEDESFQNSLQKDLMSSLTNIGENDMHEFSHKMHEAEKGHSFDRISNHPSHNKNSKENDDVKRNGAKKSYQKKTMRFLPSKSMNARSDSEDNSNKATKTTIRLSDKNATVLASKAVTNQSRDGEAHISGGHEESNAGLQFKFPYRIPFPYVRRKFETVHKNIPAKHQNINEDVSRSRATDPSHRFVNGDVFLQRRNRSRRSTQQQPQLENVGQPKDDSEKVEGRENVGEAILDSEENQQHKSSKRTTGSVEGYSIGEDEVAETNVRDNATSRPPPPTNPVEVLQRLTRLLDKMLRELSMFGQKFTLRLIRMTERQDIDQMQEIMKDFEISAVKPIFFIAGGLRKLNGSVTTVARVVTASQVETSNLTRNASVILNETVENEQNLEQLPVVVNSTSTEAEPLPLPHPEIDGTTRFPILRPSGISSLPVEYDTDNNDEETTTVNPEQESETVVLVPDPSNSPNETSAGNVTSPPPPPLITRRKRSIPIFDEFQFFPIFGRSARTENPYDDDDDAEEYEIVEPISEEGRWDDENIPHLKSPTIFTNIASDDVIDQSHSKRNDDISLVSDIAISTLPTTSAGLGSSLEKVAVLSAPLVTLNSADSSSVVIPPKNSITKAQQERSNDHKPSTHAASTTNENNNIGYEEKYPPRVNPVRTISIVDNIVNSHSSLALTIPMQIANLENKSTLVIDSTDEKLKADESLNLAHETSKQSPVVNLDSGNNLEISKSDLPAIVIPTLLHNNTLELLLDRSSDVGIVALPKETLQGEERAFPSVSKQNVAQKGPLQDNTFIKERRIDSPGIQQLLNPELNTQTLLNNGVVSENEMIINESLLLPVETLSNSSQTAESPLVTDIDSVLIVPGEAERVDSIRVPPNTTAGIEATPPLLESSGAVAPHSAVIITEPRKSNQTDPQDEIKAKSPLTQVDLLFREPVIKNLPIVTGEIKGTLSTTPTVEKVSLTPIQVEHVSLSTPQKHSLSSKPITSINNAVIEETVRDSINIADPLEVVSNVVPLPLQTEESNILLVRPVVNPAEIIVNGESIENEDQTAHDKKQSLTLVENQEDLVEDVMKKVVRGGGGEKDEIGKDKVQLIPNQATFHAPTTVLKESKIIGNNNATFLLSDKTSSIPTTNASPIHNDGSGITSDNIDTAAVRKKELVSVQNSGSSHDDDGGATEESRDGSIVVPVAIVDDEMRDLSIAGREEYVDVLLERVVAVPQENHLSQENILLSPIEVVAVPLGNAVGTVSSEDTLNVDESSGNDSVDLPHLASDRFEDVLLQPENKILTLAKSEDVVLHQDEDVRQEEIKNVLDISAAATDPTNLERDVTKLADTTKIESVPADIVKTPVKIDLVPSVATLVNEDISVSIPEVTKTPSQEIQVVEAIRVPSNEISNDGNMNAPPVQTPVIGKISPVVVPIVESVKVAPVKVPFVEPVEAPITESVKVVPVEAPIIESGKVDPVEVPIVESIKIDPIKATIVESVRVTPVEVPIVEPIHVAPVEAPIVESVKIAPVETPIVDSVKVAPVEVPIVESVHVMPVEASIVELVKVTPVEIPIIDSQVTPMLPAVSNISPVETSNIGILNVPSVVSLEVELVNTPPSNVPMITKQFANPVDAVNSDTLNPIIVQTRNPESVKVDDILLSKPENNDIVQAIKELSSVSNDVPTSESIEKNTPADIPIVPLIGTQVSAMPDISPINSHEENPNLTEKLAALNNVPVQNIPVEIPKTKLPVSEASLSTDLIVGTKVDPVSSVTPALVSEVSSAPSNVIGSNTERVKPEVVLPAPGEEIAPAVLIPAHEVFPEPVIKVAQQSVPQETVEPVQMVNKIAQPILQPSSQPVSAIAYAGTGDEIGILPESDPDSHFGIKPIDTQPHFQIPGLKPSIPERPHPDLLAVISQGIDTDTATLLFSPPTNPVVVPSPPVYSGYSPASIFRKQQQMMQNYFSGLLYRRALPV